MKMFTVQLTNIPDAGTHYFQNFNEAFEYGKKTGFEFNIFNTNRKKSVGHFEIISGWHQHD